MRRATLLAVGAGIALVLSAGPASAAAAKPDGFIRELPNGEFKGKNVYSPPTPVTPDQTLVRTGDSEFIVKVKYRATQRDTFRIQVQGGAVNDAYRKVYYKGNDVTDEAEAGDFKLKRVPSGGSKKLKLVHGTPELDSAIDSFVTATSRNNDNESDTVHADTPPNT